MWALNLRHSSRVIPRYFFESHSFPLHGESSKEKSAFPDKNVHSNDFGLRGGVSSTNSCIFMVIGSAAVSDSHSF